MTTMDLCMLSATELTSLYRTRQLSPVEVTRAVIDRVEKYNPTFNAFCIMDAEQALVQAGRSEDRYQNSAPLGPVDGIPTTVKDLILAKGWPTRRGSQTIDPDSQTWDQDGPPVARLRAAGAIILGKTTTPEFGWKGVTDSPLTGVTGNPWRVDLTPGGSSGGAAVACALGMGHLHVATDGGGSIRIPSGFCGLFGFKPTFGLVPVHPHSPTGSLWHQGPIARSVNDAALMLSVIAKPDGRDWAEIPLSIDFARSSRGMEGLHDLRVAYSPDLGYATVDPEIARAVERVADWFEESGAIVEKVTPGFDNPLAAMVDLWSVALAMAVDGFDDNKRACLDPPILDIAEHGRTLGTVGYRKAERQREVLGTRMSQFHLSHDVLLTPQLPIQAFPVGHEVPPDSNMTRWWDWSPFTYPFNMTQQPAATLPCGMLPNGMPVAAQLVAARFNDMLLIDVARNYEAEHPIALPQIV